MGYLILLSILAITCFIAAYIAERRNRRMWLWALLTFLFSPLVILILLALPKVRPRKACPDCKEMVFADAKLCRYCGYRFARQPGAGSNPANTATG